jgi:hypothetical protein
MRLLASTVLLALLAACTVTTTGAPCSSDLNCPSDQGCGNDGKCGTAALACPGHTNAGQCIPGTSCQGGELATCTSAGGVCSTGPVTTPCPAHQQCTSSASAASCACASTRCSPVTSSFCGAGGQVVTCAQDAPAATGCWYEASSASCGDPGKTCVENASSGSAACVCPTVNACTTLGEATCDGSKVSQCLPVVSGSLCLAWKVTDCAASSLLCSLGAGACVCPDNPGPEYVADALGGSPVGAPPNPTGLASPAACRYRTLTDALTRASGHGSGSTVRARGWSASVPGGVVVFSEPGALSIGAGVTLTTDDAVPAIGHYAMTTAAPLTGAFVTLAPGSSVSGFEVKNEVSTGAGVQTACPATTDIGPVLLSAVRIAAASGGTPVVRFASGVHLTGYCPATMANVTVDGATTGILGESSPLVESTATAPHVTGSTVVGVSVLEGKISVTGGIVDVNASGVSIGATGTGSPGFSATGTTFSGNTGDAIYVGRGTLFSDGCPYVNNGTHVHAQPVGGAAVNVTVQNSTGTAKMTGATNSAFRLLGMGSSSTLALNGNEIVRNEALEPITVGSVQRRGGGIVWLAPFPGAGNVTFQGNTIASNAWDQVLVAASSGTLSLAGGLACGSSSNTFACYSNSYPVGQPPGAGLYSNGASISVDWNHWTNQPGQAGVDVVGVGVSGFIGNACIPSTVICQ